MGKSSSKPEPSPLLDRPWQQMNWGGTEADLQFVNNYKPVGGDVQQLRILLHGPIGTGKSSFINSVNSIFQGKVCISASANNSNLDCWTKKYKTYRIKKSDGQTFYPFVLNDMIGLKNATRKNRRNHIKDVKKALKGHIKDGYSFNPERPISKENHQYYNNEPNANDKVHILICVIDANTVHLLGDDVVETMQDIRDDAANLGIPQVAILTKIDDACPAIHKDIKNVFKSRILKERIQLLSKQVGIPENCIFPVKNYSSERNLNDDTSALILNTLRRIIEMAD